MKFNNSENSFNLTLRSDAPVVKATGDVYHDDGTNTNCNTVGPRVWNGSVWHDFGYCAALSETIINSVAQLPTPTDTADGLGTAYRLPTGRYIIGADISIAYPIAAVDGAIVEVDMYDVVTVTYIGTGAAIRSNATTSFAELIVKNARFYGDGTNTLCSMIGDGSNRMFNKFVQVENFASLGICENYGFILFGEIIFTGFTTGLAFDDVNSVILDSIAMYPASGLNGPCLTVDGGSADSTFSVASSSFHLLNANQEALDVKTTFLGFSFLLTSYIDISNSGIPFTSASQDETSIKFKSTGNQGVSDSHTIGSFYMERNTTDTVITDAGETGDFQSIADAGGGDVTVTSAGHGLSNGDVIWLIDDEYTGKYTISSVTTNTFDITATWTETTSGTWETHWVKVAGTTIGLKNERASQTANNQLTFENLETQTSTISLTANSSNDGVASAKAWEIAIMQNGARLKGSLITRQMTNVVMNSMAVSSGDIVNGDVFEVYVRNVTDATNCIFVNMTLIIEGH